MGAKHPNHWFYSVLLSPKVKKIVVAIDVKTKYPEKLSYHSQLGIKHLNLALMRYM